MTRYFFPIFTLFSIFFAIAVNAAQLGCGPKTLTAVEDIIDCTTPARADFVDALQPTVQSGMNVVKDASGKITTSALSAFFGVPNLKTEGGVILFCAERKVAALLAGLLPSASSTSTSALAARSTGPAIDAASLQAALDAQAPGVKFKLSP